jgi:hypothetical protein
LLPNSGCRAFPVLAAPGGIIPGMNNASPVGTPVAKLVELLADHRRRGVDFPTAWASAVPIALRGR